MNRYEAIETIAASLTDDDVVLATTGRISRELFEIKDRNSNFYMLGSMGLVSSVGLGIALNTSKRVFILDGDGSALMDMGNMATIAAQKPSNLIHIILDNECYQSTGGQPTDSDTAQLDKIASYSGYGYSVKVSTSEELKTVLEEMPENGGPCLILVKVLERADAKPPRVSISPRDLSERFTKSISHSRC